MSDKNALIIYLNEPKHNNLIFYLDTHIVIWYKQKDVKLYTKN